MKRLLGNTFPLTLVRRRCQMLPIPMEMATQLLALDGFESFWGHSNTTAAAKAQLGLDVTPTTDRPAITLDEQLLPVLNGTTATEVLVVSPEYRPGFRPAMGVEVGPEDILGWQAILVTFNHMSGLPGIGGTLKDAR